MVEDYKFVILDKEKDRKILDILESSPLDGKIQLTFSARPSYFNSLKIIGDDPLVIGAVSNSGMILGFGTISTQQRYVMGKETKVGYMSNMRIIEKYRGKGIASNTFTFLKKLLKDYPVDYYIASIGAENTIATDILTRQRKDYPFFSPVGNVHSKLIYIKKRPTLKKSELDITSLEKPDIEEASFFLSRLSKKKDFFPVYPSLSNFCLDTGDFVVAKKEERIVGICAIWKEAPFRQIIINRYKFPLSYLVKYADAISLFRGEPRLPTNGELLNFSYLSHIAVENNDAWIFSQLLTYVINNRGTNSNFCIVGLHDKDPLNESLDKLRGVNYKTKLYIVSWNKPASIIDNLKKNIFYPEIAIL